MKDCLVISKEVADGSIMALSRLLFKYRFYGRIGIRSPSGSRSSSVLLLPAALVFERQSTAEGILI